MKLLLTVLLFLTSLMGQVTWTVTPPIGTMANGVYQAPLVTAPTTVTITGTDAAGNKDVYTVTIGRNASMLPGESRQFTFAGVIALPPPTTVMFLSDLPWASMTNGWGPVEKNMSNGENGTGDGRVMAMGTTTYTKGLGTHAPSDIHYNVRGCTTFASDIGIDNEIRPNGSVVFQVYGDGAKLYDSGKMTATSMTQKVSLNIIGKSDLRLVVTDSGDGINSDHADWGFAIVTCPSVPPPAPPPTAGLTPSGPITIDGKTGVVIEGLRITSPTGRNCVTITNSKDITLRRNEITQCGSASGNGVDISASDAVKVQDSWIHTGHRASGCCDTSDGILVHNNSTNIEISGIIAGDNESNIEILNSNGAKVLGNFLYQPLGIFPRGQNVQVWDSKNVEVGFNYGLSTNDLAKWGFTMAPKQEDSFNFGVSDTFSAHDNYVRGGDSGSGTCIIADDRANNGTFLRNICVDTGQGGLGITSGINHLVQLNRILNRNPVAGGGNTALFVYNPTSGLCGPVSITGNIATTIRLDGTQSGYWNGGGCGATESGNTWNKAAQDALEPIDIKFPAPSIPPKPFACSVPTPWTTNTSVPRCW